MSRTAEAMLADAVRFPRVSGDEPRLLIIAADGPAFSPRERG